MNYFLTLTVDYLDLMHKDYKDVTFLVGLLECWSCLSAGIAQFKITIFTFIELSSSSPMDVS